MYAYLCTKLIKIHHILYNWNYWFQSTGIHFADFSLLRIITVYKPTQTLLGGITTIGMLYEAGIFCQTSSNFIIKFKECSIWLDSHITGKKLPISLTVMYQELISTTPNNKELFMKPYTAD
jgi:hypothetical protein